MTGVDDAAQASYDESPSMRKPPTARGSREKVSRGYASGGGGVAMSHSREWTYAEVFPAATFIVVTITSADSGDDLGTD